MRTFRLTTHLPFTHHSSLAPDDAAGAQKLQQELLSQWVRSRFISISLIGVNVGIGDAPILGAIALLIACMWFYLSIRRENYNIGQLVRDAVQEFVGSNDASLLWRVYHGINSYTIFTRVVRSDVPIENIKGEQARNEEWSFLGRKHSFISFLYYLPVIATGLALVFDMLSVYTFTFRSGFRHPDDRPLFQIIREKDPGEEYWLWLWWIVTFMAVSLLISLCMKAARFASSTESVMAQLLQVVLRPEPSTDLGSAKE